MQHPISARRSPSAGSSTIRRSWSSCGTGCSISPPRNPPRNAGSFAQSRHGFDGSRGTSPVWIARVTLYSPGGRPRQESETIKSTDRIFQKWSPNRVSSETGSPTVLTSRSSSVRTLRS